MIEMQVIFAAALYALTLISFPNLQFHGRRNHAIVIQIEFQIAPLGLLAQFQFELKYLAFSNYFLPCIHQSKEPIKYPYP